MIFFVAQSFASGPVLRCGVVEVGGVGRGEVLGSSGLCYLPSVVMGIP